MSVQHVQAYIAVQLDRLEEIAEYRRGGPRPRTRSVPTRESQFAARVLRQAQTGTPADPAKGFTGRGGIPERRRRRIEKRVREELAR